MGNATEGKIGDNVFWSYDTDTHTLSIKGEGAMQSTDSDDQPYWHIYADEIVKVIISEDVTSISDNTFENFTSLEEVVIPASVGNEISTYIYHGSNMEKHTEGIFSDAFKGCTNLKKVTILNKNAWIGSSEEYWALDTAPQMEDFPETLGVPGTTTICGFEDSTAQTFAEMCGYDFELLKLVDKADISIGEPKSGGKPDFNRKPHQRALR